MLWCMCRMHTQPSLNSNNSSSSSQILSSSSSSCRLVSARSTTRAAPARCTCCEGFAPWETGAPTTTRHAQVGGMWLYVCLCGCFVCVLALDWSTNSMQQVCWRPRVSTPFHVNCGWLSCLRPAVTHKPCLQVHPQLRLLCLA